jgi:hypothetical protein
MTSQTETKARAFAPWQLKLPPLLIECLGVEDSRYTLTKPFIIGDYIYATDGRVCARTRATDELRTLIPDEPRDVPPADRVFGDWRHQKAMPSIPVPCIPRTDRVVACDECRILIGRYVPNEVHEEKGAYVDPLGIAVRFRLDRARYLSGEILRRLYPHNVYLAFEAGVKDMHPVYFRSKTQPVDGVLMPMNGEGVESPESYIDIIVDADELAT